MLKLKNVSKFYYQDGVIATGITKVSLDLHLGEFVVITGESGSGKSTLLNVLSGLDSYEDGEMYINGEETSHYTEVDYQDYRRKYVSNIFQNFNLINSYTVYQNIELSLIMNGVKRKDIRKKVNELIEQVGLKKYKHTKASKLSGGQKQRVAIARALANETPIIVADEPTGSLDSASSKDILKILHKISKNKLVIVVTHNKSEIEEYATRLIRMHDNRILEDKILDKINLDDEIEEKEVKSISNINKFRLGFRNAFNIPVKLVLMIAIFMLITLTLTSSYGGLVAGENSADNLKYNYYFSNDSDYRIVLKKEDKTMFNDSDYEKIKKLDNIDKIYEQDLMLDYQISVYTEDYDYLSGTIGIDKLNKVDLGRLPKEDNEIVIEGNPDSWYLDQYANELLLKDFNIGLEEIDDDIKNIKIVGIKYTDKIDNNLDNYKFYLPDILLQKISITLNQTYSELTFKTNDNYFESNIKINDNIPDNEVYMSDSNSSYCKNYYCVGKEVIINKKNIYEDESYTFNISKVYNNYNAKNLLGVSYDETNYAIYMNQNTYNKIFNTNNYQSSVFVKEIKDIKETNKELKKLGYETLVIRDSKYSDGEIIIKIMKILKVIMTVCLVFTLFFITYFIIKIIYKSRTSYYTTIRTLGGTKKVCVKLLMHEFITLSTFTYLIFITLIVLIKKNIISVSYLTNISKYVTTFDYVLVYLILLLLSYLISRRYGKKIFKDTIIKTYGGER